MNVSKELQKEIARRRASHIKYELCSDEDIMREIEEEKNKRKEDEDANKQAEILEALFDKQVDTLLKRGYPKVMRGASDRGEKEFLSYFIPLRSALKGITSLFKEEAINDRGLQIPILIVVRKQLVLLQDQIDRIRWRGRGGTDTIGADQLRTPKIISGYPLCYLLVDVAIEGFTSKVALEEIKKQGRLPLTIEEGVALVTHYPRILGKGSLLLAASRFSDSYSYGRTYAYNIPVLDITYTGRPRLTKFEDGNDRSFRPKVPSALKRVGSESDRKGA